MLAAGRVRRYGAASRYPDRPLRSPEAGAPARWAWMAINAVQLAFTLLWGMFTTSLGIVLRVLTGSKRPSLGVARYLFGPGLLFGAGARVKVEGLDNLVRERPYFFVANHASVIDIPVLFHAIPRGLHFIVKRELGRVPFLGWYISAMGMVFVDRNSRAAAVESVRQAAELVRGGASVVSFPEGTRSRDGRIGSFKSGAFLAAIEACAAVVPVAIVGAGAVLPPGGFRVRPGLIRVAVGTPIETAGLETSDRGRLAQQARAAVLELRARLENG